MSSSTDLNSKVNHAMSTQQNSKFSGEQYAMILNFLEDPQNMAKVCGVSGKTEVEVAPPRKIEAWKELVALINSRYKEDSENFVDEVPPNATIATEGSSGFRETFPNGNEDAMTYNALLFTNEEDSELPQSPPTDATRVHEPEADSVSVTDTEASPVVVAGSKRQPRVENSDAKKSKKDRRKELSSLCATKNPTQTRNFFAQTIQESTAAKAAALVCIEEKRLKFEQMKWDAEREEREVRRKEEEQRWMEDKEEERKRRDEDKGEKCKERRFALLQAMMAEGKSADEIQKMLSLLL